MSYLPHLVVLAERASSRWQPDWLGVRCGDAGWFREAYWRGGLPRLGGWSVAAQDLASRGLGLGGAVRVEG